MNHISSALHRLRDTGRRLLRERVAIGTGPDSGDPKTPHLWLNAAGLVAIVGRIWCLHLLVSRDSWVWGHESEPYDLCAEYYGCGPLFLLVKCNNIPPVARATCRCDRGTTTNGFGWDLCASCWKVLDTHGHHDDMNHDGYCGPDC